MRRFHRFGQTKPVSVYRVLGSTENNILQAIERKAAQKAHMQRSMAAAMKTAQIRNLHGKQFKIGARTDQISLPGWIRSAV